MKKYFLVSLVLILSVSASAADCVFTDKKVTQVERWDNGEIFVYFSEADASCPCTEKHRLAIPAGSNDDFLKSQVLLAVAGGKKTRAVGRTNEHGYCTVHGNTAELVRFRVFPE